MPYTTINKSTDHFNTKLYSGNGASSQALTGLGFQPDLVWLKDRTEASNHQLQDSVRGKSGSNYYYIHSDSNAAQSVQSDADGVNTFGTDGFTVGYYNSTAWNKSGNNYASWNWKAGNSSGSANTSGSINSTVSVNTTAGFSIVKYTGTGSNATVGHGLGAVPKMIIVKRYDGATENWGVYHVSNGNTKYMFLNSTAAVGTSSGYWNDTTPTSTLFSIGTNDVVNTNGGVYIAYCFAEKTGFSKFDKWTSTNNADGAFVYTGFAPSFVMLKEYDGTHQWVMYDNKRPGYNQTSNALFANASSAEATDLGIDILSNGYKIRSTNNQNSGNYIYMAFGQSLVGSNNIPTTAR